jgi:hypothetical protein
MILLSRPPLGNRKEVHQQDDQTQNYAHCQNQEDMHPMMAVKSVPSDG